MPSLDPERAGQLARDCWRKGTEALNSKNWDFAIEMFAQAVKLVPDNLMYRQVLRGAEHKKYGDNGKGARMAGAKLMGIKSKVKKARSKEDWDAVDLAAEEGLKVNPWEPSLNFELGTACSKREFLDVAIFAFGEAVKAEKENRDYLRALGDAHLEKENYDEAALFWGKVYELDPHDGEARSKCSQIQVEKATKKGGYREAEGTRDVATEKTAYEQARGDRSSKNTDVINPGDDPIKDLEMAIRKNPDNVDNYVRLAELHRKEKRYESALKYARKAAEMSDEPTVAELVEDVELELLRQRLDKATDDMNANPEDEAVKAFRDKTLRKLVKHEIDVLAGRVKRYPKNSQLKFDLGKRYRQVGKYSDAIQLFQQSVADQRLESEALVHLGHCFIKEKKLPLAKRQFEKALPKLNKQDDPDLFKDACYALARLEEESGNLEQAEEHYSNILEIDYNYRNVQKRLEKIQSGEAGGGDDDE